MIITKKPQLVVVILLLTGILYSENTPLFSDEVLKQQNIVDIQSVDSTIQVQLMYATTNNFLGRNVYGDLKKCYLRKEAAEKLVKAQKLLKEKHTGFSLLVYDGLRPRRIQRQMWDIVKGTAQQQYVANPATGSIHNYGAAVDLTIVDENGKPLDMGTPFDYFGVKAQPRYESFFLHPELLVNSKLDSLVKRQIQTDINKNGTLTAEEFANRLLLRETMEQAGFTNIVNEWWHFNSFSNEVVHKKFGIIE